RSTGGRRRSRRRHTRAQYADGPSTQAPGVPIRIARSRKAGHRPAVDDNSIYLLVVRPVGDVVSGFVHIPKMDVPQVPRYETLPVVRKVLLEEVGLNLLFNLLKHSAPFVIYAHYASNGGHQVERSRPVEPTLRRLLRPPRPFGARRATCMCCKAA